MILPESERVDIKKLQPTDYGKKDMQEIISWINKYHCALIEYEHKLEKHNPIRIDSREFFPIPTRIHTDNYIGGGRFSYHYWRDKLKIYIEAFDISEKQLKKTIKNKK